MTRGTGHRARGVYKTNLGVGEGSWQDCKTARLQDRVPLAVLFKLSTFNSYQQHAIHDPGK